MQEWGCELTKGNLLNSSDIEYALQDIEAVIDAATSDLTIQEAYMRQIGMENSICLMLVNL